jgi:hypothetical protein
MARRERLAPRPPRPARKGLIERALVPNPTLAIENSKGKRSAALGMASAQVPQPNAPRMGHRRNPGASAQPAGGRP